VNQAIPCDRNAEPCASAGINLFLRSERLIMLRSHWFLLPLLLTASMSHAQITILEKLAAEGGIVESTDPALVAEVERKASQIIAENENRRQQSMGASGTQGSGASSGSTHRKMHKRHSEKMQRGMHDGSGTQSPPAR
jgi:hypothetical protein